MGNNIRRCERCILPESYPGLTFDKFNVCNECKIHEKKYGNINFEKSERIIRKIFESIKSKKRKYDCIIGVSGGKDSSYVAFLCVEKYKLNPLCVTFDNGFLSSTALVNIKKLVKELNVRHVSFRPKWNLMKRLYRHFLLTTGEFCTPCNIGINSLLYRVGIKYRIPMIITGYSAYTDAGTDLQIYHVSPEYFQNVIKGHFRTDELKNFLNCKTVSRAIYHLTGRIKHIQLPRYVEWNENEIKDILYEKINLKLKRSATAEHSDCIASNLKEYLRIKEFGFSEKTLKLSALVRTGYLDRTTAIKKALDFESEILKDENDQIPKIMQMLDISKDDLRDALKKRQKPYIPTSAKLFDNLTNNEFLMKKLIYRN